MPPHIFHTQEVALFRKSALLISLVIALLSVMPLLSIGQTLTDAVAQTDAPLEWEEGQPVTQDAVPAGLAIPAVPTVPGTYYRTFSGTRFQPTSSELTFSASGGAVYATALPPGGYSFSLDFDLPQGATITEVVFFVIDNNAANFGLSLRSYNPETDVFNILESASSSGASSALQTIVLPVNPQVQVNNATTSYRLRAAPGVGSNAHVLRGARVGYTIPLVFLPLVTR